MIKNSNRSPDINAHNNCRGVLALHTHSKTSPPSPPNRRILSPQDNSNAIPQLTEAVLPKATNKARSICLGTNRPAPTLVALSPQSTPMATQTYTNKYVSDIPLKRPPETFVDEPSLLEEISLPELEFDLTNDVKDINRLHVFHAIAVMNTMLNDLIRLGADRQLFDTFRRQHLESYSIDVDVLLGQIHDDLSLASDKSVSGTGFHDDDLPLPVDTPAALLRNNLFPSSPVLLELLSPSPQLKDSCDDLSTPDERAGAFISTELLIQSTSLDMLADPITAHSNERLRKEVMFHMKPKIKVQAEHLVKCFALAKAPPLSIEQFLLRIKTYLPSVSVSVWIHSAYMIFKLCVLLDVVLLTPLNVYRFILALIRCLTKKLEDIHQRQKSFATVGGVMLKDLCKIEVSFLYLFNFKLVVSEYILNHFLTQEFMALRTFCREHLDGEKPAKKRTTDTTETTTGTTDTTNVGTDSTAQGTDVSENVTNDTPDGHPNNV